MRDASVSTITPQGHELSLEPDGPWYNYEFKDEAALLEEASHWLDKPEDRSEPMDLLRRA